MKTKAQSALEYMMTYGWAILIIVIVAAVLYSLGIFSPSSSVGATATGFAPFVTLSQSCGSTGTSLSLGNDAGSVVTITWVNVTTSTGVTLVNTWGPLNDSVSVNVAGGAAYSTTSTNAVCSTPGAHYSESVVVAYQLNNAHYLATGTISGSASS